MTCPVPDGLSDAEWDSRHPDLRAAKAFRLATCPCQHTYGVVSDGVLVAGYETFKRAEAAAEQLRRTHPESTVKVHQED